VSFTSGVLTAKSFARRNRYEVDANQELIGFGACNIASGLAQGFPVTGADSRTAVNNAMGGKTQMVGIVAGGAMLLILLFLTSPLAYVPTTALAAVILVSAVGLFDLAESRPDDAVLGRVRGRKGFHDIADYPDAKTIPGLLIYRFESNVVFYNADYFKTRIRAAIAAQKTPVEWVVVDASPLNVIDVSALNKLDELRSELAAEGISLYYARVKRHLERFFNRKFAKNRRKLAKAYRFQTLKPAIRAYLKYQKAKGADVPDLDITEPNMDAHK